MKLFDWFKAHRKTHDPAYPAQDVAELDQTPGVGVQRGPLRGPSMRRVGLGPGLQKKEIDELRSAGDPESDTAKETFIADERRNEEYDR